MCKSMNHNVFCRSFIHKSHSVFCLFVFNSTWHKLELSVKSNLNWENAFIRMACMQVCRNFSCLMFDMGGLSSLWMAPLLARDRWASGCEYYKKAGWASHQSTPARLLLQLLYPGSCLVFTQWTKTGDI